VRKQWKVIAYGVYGPYCNITCARNDSK